MFETILLAVDGSEHSLRAARVAANLAKAMQSQRLWVVVAYDPIPSYLGEPNLQQAISERLKASEQILQQAVEAMGPLASDVQTELLEGDAAESIIEVASTRECDVIVMGARGLGRLTGLLLGSTSQKVVAHAPCPVLIAR